MSARRYGWRPDPEHAIAEHGKAADRFRAAAPPHGSADLRSFAVHLLQGNQGSCCAHAIVLCLFVWACSRGLFAADAANLISRRWTYKLGCAIDGSTGDAGMTPTAGFRALMTDGAPLESDYGYDGSNTDPAYLDALPPMDVYRLASDYAKTIRVHRIEETGPARSLLVAQALDAMCPVLDGTYIDQAFEDASPGDIIDARRGPSLGGHATSILGYRTNADGSRDFLVRNWWGPDWADHGDGWVTEAWLDDCVDVWVVDSSGVAS